METENKILYRKSQKATDLSIILICIASIFCVIFQDTLTTGISIIILLICYSLFHKLTITIDPTEFVAEFGWGLIKKRIPIASIDFNTITKEKIKWFMGIGIRFTSQGTLYNVKYGHAIKLKTKKGPTYLFGTEEFEKIKEALMTIQNIE